MDQERVSVLVERVILQDGAAFTELYDETVRSVYRLVYLLVGFRSDADDITQEIYIQLYKSLPKYDATKSFKPWLTGLIVNVVNQYWRRQQRLATIQRKAASENISKQNIYNGKDQAIDQQDELLTEIERLPMKQKQVIILHYYEEQTHEEIAGALEIPLGTVKSRLHAALIKLRQSSVITKGEVDVR